MHLMEPVTAVLFDFDGVLADSEPLHWKVWREVLGPVGIDLEWPWYEAHCIGHSERKMLEALATLSGNRVNVDELWPFYPHKKKRFRELALVEPLISEDSLEAIRSLDGLPMAVVTSSGQAEIEPILRRYALLERMATCVYGGDVTALKPDPAPYLLAKRRLGVDHPVAFEDSAAGIASATAAGCEVVAVKAASDLPGLIRQHVMSRVG